MATVMVIAITYRVDKLNVILPTNNERHINQKMWSRYSTGFKKMHCHQPPRSLGASFVSTFCSRLGFIALIILFLLIAWIDRAVFDLP